MPKLEHWIIASKDSEVLTKETKDAIIELGAVIGDAWSNTHQHICVTPFNKEQIEGILRASGYAVSYVSEKKTLHPELHPEAICVGSQEVSELEVSNWLIASRLLAVLDKDTLKAVLDVGGQIGGGWCEIHQHIRVDKNNREKVEEILRAADLTVSPESHHH